MFLCFTRTLEQMGASTQVSQPDPQRLEALVGFSDGSRATITTGIAGIEASFSSVSMKYTYGPNAGSTVNLSFGFDDQGKPADGAITPKVSGNHPSARTYAQHAIEALSHPVFQKIMGAGIFDLGQSGSQLAKQLAATYGVPAEQRTLRREHTP